jgi:Ricin-type beta-trefoil lectin domain
MKGQHSPQAWFLLGTGIVLVAVVVGICLLGTFVYNLPVIFPPPSISPQGFNYFTLTPVSVSLGQTPTSSSVVAVATSQQVPTLPLDTGSTTPSPAPVVTPGNSRIAPAVQPTNIPVLLPTNMPPPASSVDYYSLVSKISGLCLDIQNESQANGAHVWQVGCNGKDNQLWNFRQKGSYYEIVAKHSGKCISAEGGSSGDGINMVQLDCAGGMSQQWEMVPGNSGYYQLRAQPIGMCMDVSMGGREPGDYIIQWPCNGGDNQLWLRR